MKRIIDVLQRFITRQGWDGDEAAKKKVRLLLGELELQSVRLVDEHVHDWQPFHGISDAQVQRYRCWCGSYGHKERRPGREVVAYDPDSPRLKKLLAEAPPEPNVRLVYGSSANLDYYDNRIDGGGQYAGRYGRRG